MIVVKEHPKGLTVNTEILGEVLQYISKSCVS